MRPTATRLEDYIYKGYIAGLDDPYAAYYNAEEYAQLMEEDSGEYRGIGVTVRQDTDTGYVVVEEVNKNGPAYNAGVQVDDIIMQVDGQDTAELGLQETVSAIKKNDEPVVLTILRGQRDHGAHCGQITDCHGNRHLGDEGK